MAGNYLVAVFLLSIALLLSGCVSSGDASGFPTRVSYGQVFKIRPGGSVELSGSGNNLTFSGAQSSLCPKNVQCIWEGEVRASALIVGKGGEVLEELTFSYFSGNSRGPGGEGPSSDSFQNRHFFRLISLVPDPYSSKLSGYSPEYAVFQYSEK